MHADTYPQGPLTHIPPGSADACPAPATANTTGTATAPNPAAVFPRIPDQLITVPPTLPSTSLALFGVIAAPPAARFAAQSDGTLKHSSMVRFHHLFKTFHAGPAGWTEHQLADG